MKLFRFFLFLPLCCLSFFVNCKTTDDIFIIENNFLYVEYIKFDESIVIQDKRSSQEWIFFVPQQELIFDKDKFFPEKKVLSFTVKKNDHAYNLLLELSEDSPEIICTTEISEKNKVSEAFNTSFVPVPQNFSELILSVQAGLNIKEKRFNANVKYGGGWPMPFVGQLDGESGVMAIVETPNDFKIKKKGNSLIARWISEKGKFGYSRKIRYIFFDQAGYVKMAKKYREYAEQKGLLKKLKDKNGKRNDNIAKLVGSVNVWYWGKNKREFAKELKKSGINKVLFSNVGHRNDIKYLNTLGYLTSKYDNYKDVWPPIYHNVTKRHEGWPEALVLDENGEWIKGWTIKRGLKEYPGGVVCSKEGLKMARKRIPAELKNRPYTARFIDTLTCSYWKECYNPEHPTTRTEDIEFKMKILDFCSNEMGLVTGSENGVDCAVPYCDYFEGMMSIGKGRLPDSGRNVAAVEYMEPTDDFLKYQVGHECRIPLWELVYHDCVVSTWYWGDSNNRIPEYWWKKDLFNILYGNMPLWAIRNYKHWKQYKDRFIESYNHVCPVFEKVGFAEMLSHRFLTEDRTVQETVFSNNVRIIVNFGEKTYALSKSELLVPDRGYLVIENNKILKTGRYAKEI